MTQAKVCQVTGKLQYTSDLQWCLTVVVTDDSHEQLPAKLSNEVKFVYNVLTTWILLLYIVGEDQVMLLGYMQQVF